MSSTAVARPDDLAAPPAVQGVDRAKFELIRQTVAKDATPPEAALFLELCVKYDLDPFAHEAWCVKSPGRDGGEGRLMVMVGRDGLRKIAQQSQIELDGDVHRKNDVFRVKRTPQGREIIHEYEGDDEARGPIVGAWAQATRDPGSGRTPQERGYYYASIAEFKPTNDRKLKFSPWGSQESVMILAAAERQALRQATPLSGLLVEGEGERNAELAQGLTAEPDGALEQAVSANLTATMQGRALDLMTQMNALAPNSWTAAKVEMLFTGKSPDGVSQELQAIERAIDELRSREQEEPEEAEVVEPAEVAPPEVQIEMLSRRLVEDDSLTVAEKDGIVQEIESLQAQLQDE